MRRIYVVGTADTKGADLRFLADAIGAGGGNPVIVDVGTRTPSTTPDLSAAEVAGYGAAGLLALQDRGETVPAMAYAFARFFAQRDDIAGVIGIGGSGGTAIVTAGMRVLPIGAHGLDPRLGRHRALCE